MTAGRLNTCTELDCWKIAWPPYRTVRIKYLKIVITFNIIYKIQNILTHSLGVQVRSIDTTYRGNVPVIYDAIANAPVAAGGLEPTT